MNLKQQIEEAKRYLLALNEELVKVDKLKNKTFNIFGAVGMQTQEIKHSAFLAWLLNPVKPDNLKFDFLREFLKDVYRYSSNEIVNNKIISLTARVNNEEELLKLINVNEIRVITEYPLVYGEEGRIDIYVEIPQTQTIIVIENKTFTTSHDDQLRRYVKEFENKSDWHKIFIYLTPKGDLPTEEYENWCLYSYERINVLLSAMVKYVTNRKLKYLIGDYIDMVDTNILQGNKELKSLCKQICREHKEAVELLLSYTDNIEEVQKYCAEWFKINIPNITFKGGKTTFEFYTDSMKKVFEINGQNIALNDSNLWKCRCVFGYGENVPIVISLQKNVNEEWDIVQSKIINYFAPQKKPGNKYFTINEYSTEILSIEERNMDFESVKSIVDKQLSEFANKLQEFEKILKTL